MAEKNLHSKTRELLKNRPEDVTLKRIADDTKLNYNWLRSFSVNRIPNPGVEHVQKLHNYLLDLHDEAAA